MLVTFPIGIVVFRTFSEGMQKHIPDARPAEWACIHGSLRFSRERRSSCTKYLDSYPNGKTPPALRFLTMNLNWSAREVQSQLAGEYLHWVPVPLARSRSPSSLGGYQVKRPRPARPRQGARCRTRRCRWSRGSCRCFFGLITYGLKRRPPSTSWSPTAGESASSTSCSTRYEESRGWESRGGRRQGAKADPSPERRQRRAPSRHSDPTVANAAPQQEETEALTMDWIEVTARAWTTPRSWRSTVSAWSRTSSNTRFSMSPKAASSAWAAPMPDPGAGQALVEDKPTDRRRRGKGRSDRPRGRADRDRSGRRVRSPGEPRKARRARERRRHPFAPPQQGGRGGGSSGGGSNNSRLRSSRPGPWPMARRRRTWKPSP